MKKRLLYILCFLTHLAAQDWDVVFEEKFPSIVEVLRLDNNGFVIGNGSGFFIEKNGYIITNYHVIDGCAKVRVITYDSIEHDTEILDYEADKDLALLKINTDYYNPLTINLSYKKGESIACIGNPLGTRNTITRGIISNIGPLPEKLSDFYLHDVIQTDAAINGGNSGGCMLNKKGEVIGVPFLTRLNAQNMNFAIPIKYAQNLYNKNSSTNLISKSSSKKNDSSSNQNTNFVVFEL